MAPNDPSTLAVTAPLVTGPSLSDQAYRTLREMITSGVLLRGERITERALGEQLGVSATPIREAFRRLEHERLIERRDGRTVTVVDPSDAHLVTLNMIQGALRGVAARLAAASATEDDLSEIRAAYEQSRKWQSTRPRPTATQRVLTTRRFHELIDRAAHNDLLVDMIATSTAFDLAERVHAADSLREQYPTEEGLNEHREILVAILDHDGDRAETLMRAHVSRTGAFFLSLRESADRDDVTAPAPRKRKRR